MTIPQLGHLYNTGKDIITLDYQQFFNPVLYFYREYFVPFKCFSPLKHFSSYKVHGCGRAALLLFSLYFPDEKTKS
jgi:peroxiredoxin